MWARACSLDPLGKKKALCSVMVIETACNNSNLFPLYFFFPLCRLVRGRAKNGGADVLDERRKRAPGQTRINREKEEKKKRQTTRQFSLCFWMTLGPCRPVSARRKINECIASYSFLGAGNKQHQKLFVRPSDSQSVRQASSRQCLKFLTARHDIGRLRQFVSGPCLFC